MAPPCQPGQPQPCPSQPFPSLVPPAHMSEPGLGVGLGHAEGHGQLWAASGGPESSALPGHTCRPALPFGVAESKEGGGKLEAARQAAAATMAGIRGGLGRTAWTASAPVRIPVS